MPHAYPILLNLAGRRVVIVGGGKVAARKAAGLLDAGADDVTVIAPAFAGGFADSVRQVAATYAPEALDGASLVFAATDSADVNARVVRDARARNLFVCRADGDDDAPGDFVTPAKFGDAHLLVAVSAGSAALSTRVRDAIGKSLDPVWARMARAMATLRPWVRGQDLPQERRAAVFRTLASDAALAVLAGGDVAALRAWAIAQHPELRGEATRPPREPAKGGRDDD
jgi:precorrin-2 dehydrogenase/sirohydrochlorin ferrochelatase